MDWGFYIMFIAKTASKEIGTMVHSMKFLSWNCINIMYKFTLWPYMEYSCDVWAGASNSYLELLDQLQKQIVRTVGPSLNLWLIIEM